MEPQFRFAIAEKADAILCIHEEYLVYLDAKCVADFSSAMGRIVSSKELTSPDLAAAHRILLSNIQSIYYDPQGNTLQFRLGSESSRTRLQVSGIEDSEFVGELVERSGLSGPTHRKASFWEYLSSRNSIIVLMLLALGGVMIGVFSGWDQEAANTSRAGWAAAMKGLVTWLLAFAGKTAFVLLVLACTVLAAVWIRAYLKRPELACYAK